MNNKLILAARILIFAVAVLWVVFFLLAGFAVYSGFMDFLEVELEASGGLQTALSAWYIITVIIIGVAVAYWGFRKVGKWEVKESNSKVLSKDE